jgi:hypothetical protein
MRDPEEAREAAEGLAYEEWRDRMSAVSEDAEQVDAYELDDPKHPTFHERFADIAEQGDE